ncbi:hypothetical protein Sipo8835_28395 [Streptomyces ipomoeae]|uniref:Uncharacterized protein n=1 Tax=Streptomyces ipomoeae TaxID=103232 RepID=A0AAE8VYK0_9ACTN|nr:hypothetical protein [Streptomyces ipomoeae]TQE26961.1 hypothetical protein Sipo8835_28395 [Streptomyces ipomoeae]
MRNSRISSLLLAPAVSLAILGGASPALANDAASSTSQPTSFGKPCEPGYDYFVTGKAKKEIHKGVGVEQANTNGTSRSITSTFTSTVTGSVGVTVSGELKTKASVAVAEIEQKYGLELSLKLTAKLGNRVKVKTPPKKTTHARYGIYRVKTTGYSQYIYADCRKGKKFKSTLQTPRRVGWYVWES